MKGWVLDLHEYYPTGYSEVKRFARKLAQIETGAGSKLPRLRLAALRPTPLRGLPDRTEVGCLLSETDFRPRHYLGANLHFFWSLFLLLSQFWVNIAHPVL